MLSTRSTVINPIDSGVVPTIYSELRFAEYFQLAIVTVLLYDTITTLDKEIKFFWNRYIGIFSAIAYLWYNTYHVTRRLCQRFSNPLHPIPGSFTLLTAVASNWITINMIDYILLMRVLALFAQGRYHSFALGLLTKKATILLRTLFGIEAAAMFAILSYVQIFNGREFHYSSSYSS
ncbi:uncharacterized protein FOMMEDRAFT_30979 [Fomitiporia mediterranea MF3/22]|uniref:uncharacterized protein n=1 Tax=Fomitiporia mediterranea (strain MF3/22) TaxID=694068 RepID=UPI00044080E4|nr:uncharacterized protein FOMMEDRAFT_30979 [Fomitiporia mediterranea MF3/22]EJC99670.1 hypothetical protein FOMMEDRAFT_30979 [Fomitiporia mediterranea MF3/22]